jgi:hypothetical protein
MEIYSNGHGTIVDVILPLTEESEQGEVPMP